MDCPLNKGEVDCLTCGYSKEGFCDYPYSKVRSLEEENMAGVICPQKDERFVELANTLNLCAGVRERETGLAYCKDCSLKSKCDAWWAKVCQQGSQTGISLEQFRRWLLEFKMIKHGNGE